jgi:hypothetical protein
MDGSLKWNFWQYFPHSGDFVGFFSYESGGTYAEVYAEAAVLTLKKILWIP